MFNAIIISAALVALTWASILMGVVNPGSIMTMLVMTAINTLAAMLLYDGTIRARHAHDDEED